METCRSQVYISLSGKSLKLFYRGNAPEPRHGHSAVVSMTHIGSDDLFDRSKQYHILWRQRKRSKEVLFRSIRV